MGADVPAAIIERLRCPSCRGAVHLDGDAIACDDGHRLPITEGVIRTDLAAIEGAAQELLEGFGYEWEAFPEIQPEDEPFFRRYAVDLDLSTLAGSVGVDVGCGKGRFAWFLAPHLNALLAFDGADSVRVAARNLGTLANVAVAQADLHHPPLAERSFGFVCCIGVLHYVPDPDAGFDAVERLLAPGGTMLLSVYSRAERSGARALGLRAAEALRRVSPRVPRPLLRWLSAPLAAVLYALVVLPGRLGARAGIGPLTRLPLQTYRGRPLRSLWLDTFNRLGAPFEHRFARGELERWFERAGLEVLAMREDAGWIVVARKPAI